MRRFGILSAPSVVLLVAMCAPSAFAANLPPGGTVFPVYPDLGSLLGSIAEPVTASPTGAFFGGSSGLLISQVYTDLGTGDLDFVYQYQILTGSLEALSIASFAGFTTNVGIDATVPLSAQLSPYNNDFGGNSNPSSISETGDGSTIFFSFQPPVVGQPYTATAILVVQTDATSASVTDTALVIDALGGSVGVNAWTPTPAPAPTPEPAEAGVLLGGLFAAGLFAARKFRVQRS